VCDKHPPKKKALNKAPGCYGFATSLQKKRNPFPLLLRPKSSELDKKYNIGQKHTMIRTNLYPLFRFRPIILQHKINENFSNIHSFNN
jgi:hypothetical protein